MVYYSSIFLQAQVFRVILIVKSLIPSQVILSSNTKKILMVIIVSVGGSKVGQTFNFFNFNFFNFKFTHPGYDESSYRRVRRQVHKTFSIQFYLTPI